MTTQKERFNLFRELLDEFSDEVRGERIHNHNPQLAIIAEGVHFPLFLALEAWEGDRAINLIRVGLEIAFRLICFWARTVTISVTRLLRGGLIMLEKRTPEQS